MVMKGSYMMFYIYLVLQSIYPLPNKVLDKAREKIQIKARISTLLNKFGGTIATCKLNLDLYELGTTITFNENRIAILTTIHLNKVNLWHLQLGHKSTEIKTNTNNDKRVDSFDEKEVTLCQPCIKGKQYKEKFPTQGTQRWVFNH